MASKAGKKLKKKYGPYKDASDEEKVERNWNIALKYYKQGHYSVAVLRCGTCVELATNFVIRKDLVTDRKLPLPFVNHQLKRANGLRSKYQDILLEIKEGTASHAALKKLWGSHIEGINDHRNKVAHSGELKTKKTAKEVLVKAAEVLAILMTLYTHSATIKPFVP